tara:strand:+ start:1270 stop:2010 length:741 start_codon:yes stop_codon:yes gene_type:complete
MKNLNEIKPYTYLVKFKPTGKVYYGSRCQNATKFNRTPAEDFWNHYTTSSENINNLINKYGKDAFEYEIRRTFNSIEEMASWETRVLTRCRVLERQDRWMNGNIAGYKIVTEAGVKKISATHKDKPKTDEHKKNLSKSQKGKPKKSLVYQTVEYKKNMSRIKTGEGNARFGAEVLQSTRDKISKANKGNIAHNKGTAMTEEQKAIIRATKEKNKVMLTCEVCNKTMRESHFKMYKHGVNCAAINIS